MTFGVSGLQSICTVWGAAAIKPGLGSQHSEAVSARATCRRDLSLPTTWSRVALTSGALHPVRAQTAAAIPPCQTAGAQDRTTRNDTQSFPTARLLSHTICTGLNVACSPLDRSPLPICPATWHLSPCKRPSLIVPSHILFLLDSPRHSILTLV